MSPKQKKIAAKAPPPNKITGADFAVLRKEKAKGRGMGLQDESIKPGKVMKAREGKAIKKDPTKPISSVAPKVTDALKKKKLPGRIGTALGIGAMMVPAAYAAAKQYKDYKSAKNRDKAKVKKYSVGGGADTGRAGERRSRLLTAVQRASRRAGREGFPSRPSPKRTPRGGPMPALGNEDRLTNKDLEYVKAGLTGAARPIGTSVIKAAKKFRDNYKADVRDQTKVKKMGGGMMQRPMGYKSGTMVKARGCKLGRTRPTKIT